MNRLRSNTYLFLTQLSAGTVLIMPSVVSPFYFAKNLYTLEGYLFSFEFLGMLFGSLASGRIADSIGRRQALAMSIGLYSVGSFIPAIGGINAFFVGFFIAGLGIGANVPVANAMMNELSDPGRRGLIMAIGNAMFNLGFVVAPVFIIFRAINYIFYFGLAQLVLLVPILWVPETLKTSYAPHNGSIFSKDLRVKTMLASATTFFVFFSTYGLVVWFPSLIYRGYFKMPEAIRGVALLVANIGAFSGALAVAPIVDRLGRRILGMINAAVAAASELLIPLILSSSGLLAAMFLSTFGMEACLGLITIIASEIYPKELRGTGLGNALAWGRIGGIVSPLVLALAFSSGLSAVVPFLIISAVSIGALAGFYVLPETRLASIDMQ